MIDVVFKRVLILIVLAMKKKFFSGVVVLLVMGVAVFNMNSVFQNDNKLSVLSLANVEALAQDTNEAYSGTSAKCEDITVIETYETTEVGWSYDIGGKFWLFNGKRTETSPPGYSKVTKTIKSNWDGCKQGGATSCTAPPC